MASIEPYETSMLIATKAPSCSFFVQGVSVDTPPRKRRQEDALVSKEAGVGLVDGYVLVLHHFENRICRSRPGRLSGVKVVLRLGGN